MSNTDRTLPAAFAAEHAALLAERDAALARCAAALAALGALTNALRDTKRDLLVSECYDAARVALAKGGGA